MINTTFIRTIRDNLFDFVAPEHCAICNKHIKPNTAQFKMLCNACLNSIPYAPPPNIIRNRLYEHFSEEMVSIDGATSLLSLKENTQYLQAIHKFKYEGLSQLAYEYGKLLGRRMQIDGMTKYEYIIPVPIHKVKYRERGYNQSYYIALGLNGFVSGDMSDDFVRRNQYTKTQTALSKEQRKHNVRNIYEINKKFDPYGSRILLVDDVLTTGSTINSLAGSLKSAGAESCDCATVAIA
ncbi:MAG: ComF family protein [Candidatus Kapabacteria bacterium]|nr:ComF family protein [Candidatus Kapabacteria bacterium]